ncbi:hypothetical protein H490_0101770 [Leucobacter sp. UCD-THU]|jgi:hypothetical protein|uniref:Uncharacterized protein n=1 Tax=Leucobacter muris TaxID=1935379 RepID=A0ABX5QH22_9MICO|nr:MULTISPECIES: hypothetical protein [Leucobacter]EYT56668.1 hypothetical protein H490_0101770 [Leucobacter sp. UCD-THU]QAB18392.1 hypothetical protein Leucomu_11115 [Leucobacter muris]
MDEQMPRAVEEGAERAEEVVEKTNTGSDAESAAGAGGEPGGEPSQETGRGEVDAARDVTDDERWQQPQEPRTTVD